MMDDEILGADRREAVAAIVPDALGEARIVGRELQVRAFVGNQLQDVGEAEHAVEQKDVGLLDGELSDDEVAQRLRHPGVDIHANDVAPPAPLESGLEGADQRSAEHTFELQSLMRNSNAVFCLKKTQ